MTRQTPKKMPPLNADKKAAREATAKKRIERKAADKEVAGKIPIDLRGVSLYRGN